MKKEKTIIKDMLVAKLQQISALMGEDINVGLKVSQKGCEIIMIGGVSKTTEISTAKQDEDFNYVG